MASYYLAPDPIQSTQFIPGGNTPANGGQLFFYVAGSTTKSTVYKDNAGGSSWTNPIVLDSGGNLPSGGEVWFAAGITYKVVFAPSTDTDPPVSPYWTKDNLSGINDISSAVSEWITGPTPTFISATSFSLVGDQTSTFQVGRRVKFTVTAGTVYGTIQTSAFTSLTTVTIQGGEGPLDSGLSAVFYSINSATNNSIPSQAFNPGSYRVLGLTAFNTTSTPNTKYDIGADVVVLRNPTTGATYTKVGPATLTCDTAAAGPVANGRDIAGAFSAATMLHFYYIWNGQTLATMVSSTSPTTGPALVSGYTHWAYVGGLEYDGSSHLLASRMKGSQTFFSARQTATTSANSTSEAAIGLTGLVPANAETIKLLTSLNVTIGSAAGSGTLTIRYVGGSDYVVLTQGITVGANAANQQQQAVFDIPNVGQQVLYTVVPSGSGVSTTADIYVLGYSMPNGGE